MQDGILFGGLAFAAGAVAGILAVQLWPKLPATSRSVLGATLALGLMSALLFGAIHTEGQGTVAANSAEAGTMCMGLAADFQQTSSRWAIASWALALVASLLSAIGGLVGRGQDNETRWYRLGAGVLLATFGSSLSATAAYSVARSNAASAAAGAATAALAAGDPSEQYKRCIMAKAQWLESRTDALDQTPPPQPKAATSNARTEPSRTSRRSAADAGAQ